MSIEVQVYGQNGSTNTYNTWYRAQKGQVYSQLMNCVQLIDQNQKYRQQRNLRNFRMYGDMPITTGGGLMFATPIQSDYNRNQLAVGNRVTLNVVKSCVDTVVSKMCKDKIKPSFLTSGGKWVQQQKSKELQKFVDGVFYEGKIYEAEYDSFLNTALFGTGFLKVFSDFDEGKICFENVMTDEIMVDDLDGYYRKPRSLYQRRYVDRMQACGMWPKKEKEIIKAPRAHAGMSTTLADLILVVEGWRLPSTKNSGDGRHVICVETCDLEDEVWERSSFPFAVNRWSVLPVGFFGQGIPDELCGIQIEINRLLLHIQTSQRLLSAPKMLVQNGSNVVIEHLNNEIGSIIKYAGAAPTIVAPSVISPDIFKQLSDLYQRAYEIVGVSQLSANSQKPSGLDSGKALREFNDIQTERFVIQGRKREDFFLEAAGLVLEEAQSLARADKPSAVKVFSKKSGVEYVKWKDVADSVEEDDFVMQVFPSSALPSTPAFRLQTVQELIQGGLIPPEYASELLDFPDLEAYSSISNAPLNNILRVLSNIIEKGVYEQPEPFGNLKLAQKLAQDFYEKARIDEVPESRLALLRRYIADVVTEIERASAPPPPPAGGLPPGPGPIPGAPMEGMNLPTQTIAPGLSA